MVKYEFTPQEVKELKELLNARIVVCYTNKHAKHILGNTMEYWNEEEHKATKLLDKIKYGQIDE